MLADGILSPGDTKNAPLKTRKLLEETFSIWFGFLKQNDTSIFNYFSGHY